jgi:hypothetical protein
MRIISLAAVTVSLSLSYLVHAEAQTATNLAVLNGLSPLTVLSKTASGKAALSSNYAVTGGIQTAEIHQTTLLPFTEQQQQALRDAFITDGNLAELADGLGTTLGAAYVARAHYQNRDHFTNVLERVTAVLRVPLEPTPMATHAHFRQSRKSFP